MLKGHKEYHDLCQLLGWKPTREPAILETGAYKQIVLDVIAFDAQIQKYSQGRYCAGHVENETPALDGKPASMKEAILALHGAEVLRLSSFLLMIKDDANK